LTSTIETERLLIAHASRRELLRSGIWNRQPDAPGKAQSPKQNVVEALRERIQAWNRREFDTVLAGYHPHVERLDFRAGSGPPFAYFGREGSRKAWHELMDAFDDLTLYPEEFLRFGNRVLMAVRVTGRARTADFEFTEQHAEIFTFDDDGLTTKIEVYRDKAAALEALQREGVEVENPAS
jgi:ketosteroid isomerase-like protein